MIIHAHFLKSSHIDLISCAKQAAAGVSRLSSAASAAREKQKAEMMGVASLLRGERFLPPLIHFRQAQGSRKFISGIVWIEVHALYRR
jgi:hypothetical protein